MRNGVEGREGGVGRVQRELYLKSLREYFHPCDLSDETDDGLRRRVQEGFPVYGREQRLLRGFTGTRTQVDQGICCGG